MKLEISQDVPVIANADVIVIGGGSGGFACIARFSSLSFMFLPPPIQSEASAAPG